MAFAIVWIACSRTIFKSADITLHENPMAASASTNFAFDGTLRVGAFNIAHGRGSGSGFAVNFRSSRSERGQRLDDIAALLREHRLDMVVLNEVDFSAWNSHGVNQARTIATAAGFPYWVEQSNYDANLLGFDFQAGNAILSRHPLKDPELIRYPNRRPVQHALLGAKQGVICTVVLPDGREIRVGAIHLDHEMSKVRVASVRRLLKRIEQSPLPVILAGDFNCEPSGNGNTALDLLSATHRYHGSMPGSADRTWPSSGPTRALDWVLVPRPWSIESKSQPPTDLSDHRPVFVQTVIHSEKRE